MQQNTFNMTVFWIIIGMLVLASPFIFGIFILGPKGYREWERRQGSPRKEGSDYPPEGDK